MTLTIEEKKKVFHVIRTIVVLRMRLGEHFDGGYHPDRTPLAQIYRELGNLNDELATLL